MSALVPVLAIAAYITIGIVFANKIATIAGDFDRDNTDDTMTLGAIALLWPLVALFLAVAILGRLAFGRRP